MKQTCWRCKAYRFDGGMHRCQLGYEINQTDMSPVEPCPKPLTYLSFIELRNERNLNYDK